MNDRVRPLRFGVAVTPDALALDDVTAVAVAADEAGLDLVAVQDHPDHPDHVDTLMFLAHLAARTSRVALLTDVADLSLRPAPMLAKAAASLDLLSGGRVEIGVGAGSGATSAQGGSVGMGARHRAGGDAVTFVDESLRVLRDALDRRDEVSSPGEQLVVPGYRPGPAPTSRVPLLVGAIGPKMLGVVGARADGWLSVLHPYAGGPDAVPARAAAIDEAARAAGRSPAGISRVQQVLGVIDDASGATGPGLTSSSRRWADQLATWIDELGYDTTIFWPTRDHLDQVRRFATEVVPRTRALLAEESVLPA